MRYLCRSDVALAAAFWLDVARYPAGAPGVVRELLASDSVVCDPLEARQAMAWARAHPAWVDEPAPLYEYDPDR
jgi:hypothetical protein